MKKIFCLTILAVLCTFGVASAQQFPSVQIETQDGKTIDTKTLIDADSGEVALYGDDFTVEDIIWTGPQPSLREQGAEAGVSNTFPLADLKTHLTKAIVQGRRIHYLPPYRGETKLLLADLLGLKPAALHDHKSVELMMAVAEMREKKGPEEIEELEKSFHIGYAMHTTAMKMCRPGIVERTPSEPNFGKGSEKNR